MAPVRHQGVRLVEEQHTVERAVDDRVGLGLGLTDVLADEVGAVHLADGLLPQKAQAAVDLGDDAGDRGLTGSGRTREHQVVGALGDGQPALLAPQRHRHRALQPRDLILDLFEADELGELSLGLDQQVGLALLGARIDEIGFAGFGGRIPRVGCAPRSAAAWWWGTRTSYP